MSFGWIAVTATAYSAYKGYQTYKETKKAARRAEQQAAEEIAAIDRQTAQMKAEKS